MMTPPGQDMKTPISRASDKLANDLVAFGRQVAQIPIIGSGDGGRNNFTLARAAVTSMEHFVRTIVREEIRAWEELQYKGEDTRKEEPRKRKSFGDEAIEQALKSGLRRMANWIEDVEGRL